MQIMEGAEAYAVNGSRTGVVLSHGFTGTPHSMMPLAEACAEQGWTVRVPLLPGHGTRWQDLNATVWDQWADHLEAACTDLLRTCDTVVVAGLSMGGTLATLMAQRHPDIDGLFLVNPAYVMRDRRLLAVPALSRVIPSIAAIGGDIKRPGVVEQSYPRTPLRALASQMKLWKVVTNDLPSMTTPVVLCHSREDHIVPPQCSELFLERCGSPNIREVVLENSYHVATLDNDAQLVIDELVQFVRSLEGQAHV